MKKHTKLISIGLILAVIGVSILGIATAILLRISGDKTGEFAATSAPPEISCISSSLKDTWCGAGRTGTCNSDPNNCPAPYWCRTISCSGTSQPTPTSGGGTQPTPSTACKNNGTTVKNQSECCSKYGQSITGGFICATYPVTPTPTAYLGDGECLGPVNDSFRCITGQTHLDKGKVDYYGVVTYPYCGRGYFVCGSESADFPQKDLQDGSQCTPGGLAPVKDDARYCCAGVFKPGQAPSGSHICEDTPTAPVVYTPIPTATPIATPTPITQHSNGYCLGSDNNPARCNSGATHTDQGIINTGTGVTDYTCGNGSYVCGPADTSLYEFDPTQGGTCYDEGISVDTILNGEKYCCSGATERLARNEYQATCTNPHPTPTTTSQPGGPSAPGDIFGFLAQGLSSLSSNYFAIISIIVILLLGLSGLGIVIYHAINDKKK